MLSINDAVTSPEWMSPKAMVENFICIIQKCRKQKSLVNARLLLLHIYERGLGAHDGLGNFLVPMLVECGSMLEAQQIFSKLVKRNEFSWTSLMQGCVVCEEYERALHMFKNMQEENVYPSRYTLQGLVKACTRLKCLEKGEELHAEIAKEGFEGDPFVGSTLVDMYSKCGSLAEAQDVFDEIPVRDVVSWNALIAAYVEHGLGKEALKCLERMQIEGVCPDNVTYVSSLRGCGSLGAVDAGHEIHAEIVKGGFDGDSFVGNSLVDMYAKCASLEEAQRVLNKLPLRDVVSWSALIAGYAEHGLDEAALNCLEQMQVEGISPNVVSWNALISGYTEHGLGVEALECFEKMQSEGVFPDAVTFLCSLKACSIMGVIDRGQELHAEIAKEGFERDVGSALVALYAKCGSLAESHAMFDELEVRDEVSWTALIIGYAERGLDKEGLRCLEQMLSVGVNLNVDSWDALIAGLVEHGLGEGALKCLEHMKLEGISPTASNFVCCLKACGTLQAIGKGLKMHSVVVQKGLEVDPLVATMLVDMYAECGSLAEAQEVFDRIPSHDEDLWTALIFGYAEQGLSEEVLNCMEQIQFEGVSPNAAIYICSLKACSSLGVVHKGQEIHAEIAQEGLERDPFVGNTLVDMYAKYGLLAEAQDEFEALPLRNVVSWSALVTGYVEHGLGDVALKCLEEMQMEGVAPDSVSFICSLKACGSIGAIGRVQEIHTEIAKEGFESYSLVCSTLVDIYAKCGALDEAQEMFYKLPVRDMVSWTALIAGYACQGDSERVFEMVERMRQEGIPPSMITFLNVLNVCSHAGLVDEGSIYFEAISKEYAIFPTIEHFNCLIDLLGRAGRLGEAVAMLERRSFKPNLVTWNTMLSACRKCRHVELGREAFECALRLDQTQDAPYILMSSIYAEANMWEDAKKIEALRVMIRGLA